MTLFQSPHNYATRIYSEMDARKWMYKLILSFKCTRRNDMSHEPNRTNRNELPCCSSAYKRPNNITVANASAIKFSLCLYS
jgi:hypothetical protein